MFYRHYLVLITMIMSILLRNKYGAPCYDLVGRKKLGENGMQMNHRQLVIEKKTINYEMKKKKNNLSHSSIQ